MGRGIKESAGVALRGSLHTGRNLLIAVVHASIRGAARDLLLFVALLGSSAAAVASVFADKIELAASFCLLALILCAALWAKGHREPSEEQRRASSTGGRTKLDVGDRVDR